MTLDPALSSAPDPGEPAAPGNAGAGAIGAGVTDAGATDAGAADAGATGAERSPAGTLPGTPEPAAHPWAEEDRPRGLDAYFAPGGEDDAPSERVSDERRMLRLLVIFVAVLVGLPTLLTLVALAGQLLAQRGGT
jgi:hypothetical protein